MYSDIFYDKYIETIEFEDEYMKECFIECINNYKYEDSTITKKEYSLLDMIKIYYIIHLIKIIKILLFYFIFMY